VGGVTWRDTFAALKHRNFRLFFAGQFVSLIGSWMQNTAQGWLVYQLTGSKVMLGTVAAVGSLPMLLFSVWGGSRRKMSCAKKITTCGPSTQIYKTYQEACSITETDLFKWFDVGNPCA
jgi:hypothetical protein